MSGKHDRAAELRAIADGRLMLNVRNGVTVSRSMLARIADEFEAMSTAIAAKDAELAAISVQLAEARKALERIEVRTRSVPSDTAEDDKRDKYHANSIARRALEAQGGE